MPPAAADQRFDQYTPLAAGLEILRRTHTPLRWRRAQQLLAQHGASLREQAVDLGGEQFLVQMPPGPPPAAGYGLLVFVPPWPEAELPAQWRGPLAHRSLIFVSAAGSGNEADVLDRRMPLALLAYENLRLRLALDPRRVYVGGMSGGSRVALRLALAYPDVFRGALLDAGSDPIGETPYFLPPADLFRRFQESTRLVYLTGAEDQAALDQDRLSQQSLLDWCVFNAAVQTVPRLAHELPGTTAIARALDALEQPAAPDPEQLAQCRGRIDRELRAALVQVHQALGRGDREAARQQLRALDERYGGLAAPTSIELDEQLDAKR